ncbi:hypothetical protein HK102_005490, partial [Quaeritorhiza haematococci]
HDDGSVNPGSNLFVTGLSIRCKDEDLEQLFGKYGKLSKCNIMLAVRVQEPPLRAGIMDLPNVDRLALIVATLIASIPNTTALLATMLRHAIMAADPRGHTQTEAWQTAHMIVATIGLTIADTNANVNDPEKEDMTPGTVIAARATIVHRVTTAAAHHAHLTKSA